MEHSFNFQAILFWNKTMTYFQLKLTDDKELLMNDTIMTL